MSNALKIILFIVFAALAYKLTTTFLPPRLTRPAPNDTYKALRNKALQGKRDQIGLPAPAHPTDPWAVIMDWGVTNATATVVAISDGTASIYLSSGGGSIGGGQSHDFRQAAQRAVAVAAEFQPQMQKVTAYPLPQQGEVTFYLLTDNGIFSASAPQTELRANRHPLSKLGNAMQEVITQYRLIQTKQ